MKNRLSTHRSNERTRAGAAIAELAMALPILLVVFAFTVDFARVYYFTQIVSDCARNGAMYASHPDLRELSPYETAEQAALAGADNLSPKPTVTSQTIKDTSDTELAVVTVKYPFKRLFPLIIKGDLNIESTSRMRVCPAGVEDD
jgi:Flp pilus assembly protein TadG